MARPSARRFSVPWHAWHNSCAHRWSCSSLRTRCSCLSNLDHGRASWWVRLPPTVLARPGRYDGCWGRQAAPPACQTQDRSRQPSWAIWASAPGSCPGLRQRSRSTLPMTRGRDHRSCPADPCGPDRHGDARLQQADGGRSRRALSAPNRFRVGRWGVRCRGSGAVVGPGLAVVGGPSVG